MKFRNEKLNKFYEGKNITISRNRATKETIENGERKIYTYPVFNTSIMDFESFIARQKVDAPYEKGHSRENMRADLENNEIPFIGWVIYDYMVSNKRFPTFDQACQAYLNTYCTKINKGQYLFKEEFGVSTNGTFTTNHIRGRMNRSYFSFAREVHLLFALMRYKDLEVTYDFNVDTKEGLDIICEYNGVKVYVASYLGSKNSVGWKNRKNHSKHAENYKDKLIVDAVAYRDGDKKNTVRCGQADLYSPQAIAKYHDAIIKMANAK